MAVVARAAAPEWGRGQAAAEARGPERAAASEQQAVEAAVSGPVLVPEPEPEPEPEQALVPARESELEPVRAPESEPVREPVSESAQERPAQAQPRALRPP